MRTGFKIFFSGLCLLLVSYSSIAQREGNIWYFGNNAALDFNKWVPRAINNSEMYAREGCASISDSDGNLVLYTNGETVWNGEHKIMVNAEGLWGNQTSTQSGIIVPHPGNHNLYYVFTVDQFDGGKGLSYSIVDMRMPGGGGIYTDAKNLKPDGAAGRQFTEKITSVKHTNGKDYWVIAHPWGGAEFFVYKVSASGISNYLPYESGVDHGRPGFMDETEESVGYIKVSPKGHKLAVAIEGKEMIQLFNFNATSGFISQPIATITDVDEAYGLEFSISEDYLYASQRMTDGRIFQWDVSKSNETNIINSRKTVGTVSGLSGALQLAPNGKIYLAVTGKKYLSVIFAPNRPGMACDFRKKGVSLGEGTSMLGLPTFVSTFFEGDGFIYSDVCLGDETQFYFTSIYEADEMLWRFGDGSTSDEVHPVHTYSSPGTYTVSLTTDRAGEDPTTLDKEITVFPLPDIDLGGDHQNLCKGSTLILDPGEGDFWLWQNGSEARAFAVKDAGTYSLILTDSNLCSNTASVEVTEVDLPALDSISTTKAFCGGATGSATVYPTGSPDDYLYEWQTNPPQLTRSAINLKYGRYTVRVTSLETGCTTIIDTVAINEIDAPEVYLESLQLNDTICPGTPIQLVAHGAQNYVWPNNSISDTITIIPYIDSVYSVTGKSTAGGSSMICSAIGQIGVTVFPQQDLELGEDRELCEGETELIDAATGNHWLWQDSSELQTYLVDTTGLYTVTSIDTFKCETSDSVYFLYHPLPPVNFGNDSTSCTGFEITLDAGEGETYLWSDSSTSRNYTVSQTGNYGVTVTSEFGCQASDDINLIFYSMDSLRIDSVVKTDISCYGYDNGMVHIYAYGQVGYFNYSIDGGKSWQLNDGVFTNLKGGQDYDIRVSERHACEISGPVIHINEPEQMQVSSNEIIPGCEDCSDGKITLSVSGGVPPYSFLWMNFETGSTLSGIPAGSYSVAVRDSLNCNYIHRINLDFDENPYLTIPSAFTPNSDGINDLWIINKVLDFPDIHVKVYDFRGRLVYESKGYPTPWNGEKDGSLLPTNSYFYFIDLGTDQAPRKGTVTIIR